jgi:hypothetical protein
VESVQALWAGSKVAWLDDQFVASDRQRPSAMVGAAGHPSRRVHMINLSET